MRYAFGSLFGSCMFGSSIGRSLRDQWIELIYRRNWPAAKGVSKVRRALCAWRPMECRRPLRIFAAAIARARWKRRRFVQALRGAA